MSFMNLEELRARLNKAKDSNLAPRQSEISDVQKAKTQIKTYLKLSQTMGVKFVINEKSRATIYQAMVMHKNSLEVATLATECLKKLVQEMKDMSAKKKVCQEYLRQYSTLMALVPIHCTDRDFSVNVCSIVLAMTDDNDICEALKTKIGKMSPKVLLADQIREAHKEDTDIRLLVGQILEILDIAEGQSHSVKAGYQRHRTMSEADLALTEAWANEALVDDFEDLGMKIDDFEMKIDNQPSNELGDTGMESVVVDQDLKDKVDELEDLTAGFDEKLGSLRERLQKLQADYMNMQISYEADKEIHATFMASMKESEANKKAEIELLSTENVELKAKVAVHRQLIQDLPKKISSTKNEVTDKSNQFEYMKTMVGTQMSEARDHYIKAISEREHTRSMATNKSEELHAKRSQLATVQQHFDEKTRDINGLQLSLTEIEANKQKQEERGKKMEAEIRKISNELGEKLKLTQEELIKVRRDVGVSMHMRENFKKGVTELTMENQRLRTRLTRLEGTNTNLDKAAKLSEKNALEKENADMKSKLFDILQKGGGGGNSAAMVQALKNENAKLVKERNQLMQLTENLLDNVNG